METARSRLRFAAFMTRFGTRARKRAIMAGRWVRDQITTPHSSTRVLITIFLIFFAYGFTMSYGMIMALVIGLALGSEILAFVGAFLVGFLSTRMLFWALSSYSRVLENASRRVVLNNRPANIDLMMAKYEANQKFSSPVMVDEVSPPNPRWEPRF